MLETEQANKFTSCCMTIGKMQVFSFKIVLTKFCGNTTCSFLPKHVEMQWQSWEGERDRGQGLLGFLFGWLFGLGFFVINYSNFSLKQSNKNISPKHCQIVACFDYFPLEVITLFK